jgi:hypothetical protein
MLSQRRLKVDVSGRGQEEVDLGLYLLFQAGGGPSAGLARGEIKVKAAPHTR